MESPSACCFLWVPASVPSGLRRNDGGWVYFGVVYRGIEILMAGFLFGGFGWFFYLIFCYQVVTVAGVCVFSMWPRRMPFSFWL